MGPIKKSVVVVVIVARVAGLPILRRLTVIIPALLPQLVISVRPAQSLANLLGLVVLKFPVFIFYELRDFSVAQSWILFLLLFINFPKRNKSLAGPPRCGVLWPPLLAGSKNCMR